jgi:hypothetical protein
MKANKQDADKLVPIFKKIEQEIEGIKFATKDNFD